MTDKLRDRAERIADRTTKPATQLPSRRVYQGGGMGGGGFQWGVIRTVNTTSKVMWVQVVGYSDSPPTEGDAAAVGDFIRAYPAPGQAYDQYAPEPLVYPLLHATTQLALDPPAGATEYPSTEAERTAFDAAILAEVLGTKFYAVLISIGFGVPIITLPLWVDPNVEYYEETAAMSEGSGAA